jgi:nucleoid-associated protein EbfC
MNMQQLLKQAQAMQQKMLDAQEELGNVLVEGSAGAGMVKITLNGKSDMKKVSIDPSLITAGDGEIIEDLIVAAYNDARTKVESEAGSRMESVTGGMALPPGFKMPF